MNRLSLGRNGVTAVDGPVSRRGAGRAPSSNSSSNSSAGNRQGQQQTGHEEEQREYLIGTRTFRRDEIDESEAYIADRRAARIGDGYGDRDVNKAMWRMHYRNEAKLQTMMNVGTLGAVSRVVFILPPLMQGNKPYMMQLDRHVLLCRSAKAAAKSIGIAAQGAPSTRFTLNELTSKREIKVLAKSDRHPGPRTRGVRQYVSRGSNMFSYYKDEYVAGFEYVGNGSTWETIYEHVVKPASFEVTMLMNTVSGGTIDERGAYMESILPAGSFDGKLTKLCDTYIAIATLNVVVDDGWCMQCKKLLDDDMTDDTVFSDWLDMLHASHPIYLQSVARACGGYGGFMPCEDGWGYLTRIVSETQTRKRGPEALSLGQVVLRNILNANHPTDDSNMNAMLADLYSNVYAFLMTPSGSDGEQGTLSACTAAIDNLLHVAYGGLYDDIASLADSPSDATVTAQRALYTQEADDIDNSVSETHIKGLERQTVERKAERMNKSLSRLEEAQLNGVPTERCSLRQSVLHQRMTFRNPVNLNRPPPTTDT